MSSNYYSDKFFKTGRGGDAFALAEMLKAQSKLPEYQMYKERSIKLLELSPGKKAIDIGCGLGDDTLRMISLVGSKGQVVGLDSSEEFLSIARSQLSEDQAVQFLKGDGRALEFGDNHFDAVRIDRVLQHFPDADRFILEAYRVLKQGGRFVVAEPDWETFVIHHSDKKATRELAKLWCDKYRNPWIGRKLKNLVKISGFKNVSVEGVTLIYPDLQVFSSIFQVTQFANEHLSGGSEWCAALKKVQQEGGFFASVGLFIVAASK